MFTRLAVCTSVTALSLGSILVCHLGAQQPNVSSSNVPRAESRTFQQLFRAGQFFSYTATDNGYALTLYTAAQKEEIEARYQEELTVYEKRVKEQDLLDAKRRELMDALRNAAPEDQAAILTEIQAIDGRADRGRGEAVLRGGFAGRGQAALEALRNAPPDQRQRIVAEMQRGGGFGRGRRVAPPRRPRATNFYCVSEVGADFLCLVRGNLRLIIPIWSIRSVASEVIADHDKVEQQALYIEMTGPNPDLQLPVGALCQYQVSVTNRGDQPLDNIQLLAELTSGWKHESGENPIKLQMKPLGPGQTRRVDVAFALTGKGRQVVTLTASANEGQTATVNAVVLATSD